MIDWISLQHVNVSNSYLKKLFLLMLSSSFILFWTHYRDMYKKNILNITHIIICVVLLMYNTF